MANTTVTAFVEVIITTNAVINDICSVLIFSECLTLLILSMSWSVYLCRKVIKEYRKYKSVLQLENIISEHQFRNMVKNFFSNQVKNMFLISICVCEFLFVSSFVINQLGRLVVLHGRNVTKEINTNPYRHIQYGYTLNHRFYYPRSYLYFRFSTLLTSISIYTMFISVRILTQYLTHQYSFYKSELRMKRRIALPLISALILVTLGLIPPLLFLHFILIVPAIVYEFLLCIIATKKLSRSLKQRLFDAKNHEAQSYDVIRYYTIANKEYKLCSTVLLTFLLLHVIALSILYIHPLVMTCVILKSECFSIFLHGSDNKWKTSPTNPYAYSYNDTICSLSEIMITIGFSLQIIPYFLVSIRRMKRYIANKLNSDKHTSRKSSLTEKLIRNNNEAYIQKYY